MYINKLKWVIDRILLHEGFFFYFRLILDKVVFKLFYKNYYKKRFLHYGDNIRWGKHFQRLTIPKSIRISNPGKISIADNCQFDEYVYLQVHHTGEGLYFGEGTRCNAFSHIQAYSRIEIGSNVLIAPFCHINSGNHGFYDLNTPIMFQEYKMAGEIYIGSGSWLCRNSQVLGGTIIGKNCVIAAGAVVKGKFLNYQVIAGIPGKSIKEISKNN